MNFLYCFDENYNKQAFTSIISLLDNVHEKINIFVIHNKKLINNEIPNKILNHQNLNMINLYEFNNREYFSKFRRITCIRGNLLPIVSRQLFKG